MAAAVLAAYLSKEQCSGKKRWVERQLAEIREGGG